MINQKYLKISLFLFALVVVSVAAGVSFVPGLGRAVLPEARSVVMDQGSAFGELSTSQFTPMGAWNFTYNANSSIVSTTTTVSGSISVSGSMISLVTGAASSSAAQVSSIKVIQTMPGQGNLVRVTAIFESGCVAGSEQVVGLGDENDGLFFGCNGGEFGVMRRQGGTDTWTAKADWSEARKASIDNAIDITKGNVYQIRFQWLGFGRLEWYIENGVGELELVHAENYANQNTSPSILHPNQGLLARVANITNTTAITLKTPSGVVGIEGNRVGGRAPLNIHHSAGLSVSTVTTESPVLSLQNPTAYWGISNHVFSQLGFVSMSSDGSKSAVFRIYKNCTLTNDSFSDFDADASPIQVDTSATVCSGGSQVAAFTLDKVDAVSIDVHSLEIFFNPGDVLIITAESDNSSDVGVFVTWVDFF